MEGRLCSSKKNLNSPMGVLRLNSWSLKYLICETNELQRTGIEDSYFGSLCIRLIDKVSLGNSIVLNVNCHGDKRCFAVFVFDRIYDADQESALE